MIARAVAGLIANVVERFAVRVIGNETKFGKRFVVDITIIGITVNAVILFGDFIGPVVNVGEKLRH